MTPAGTITDGNGGANYAVTYATTTGVINHAPLTVSATGVNKTYDGTNVATVTLSDDRITGDVLTATDTKRLLSVRRHLMGLMLGIINR